MAGGRLRATLLLLATVALAALAFVPAASADQVREEIPGLSHEGAFDSACGVATDSVGNLYVEQTSLGGKVYDPSGALLTEFAFAGTAGSCTIAVDSAGAIYSASFLGKVNKLKPSEFPPTASTTYSFDTAVDGTGRIVDGSALGVNALGLNPATQNIYVTEPAGNEIQEINTPGEEFKLKCNGNETETLAAAATNAQIKEKLEAAPVSCGTVAVANAPSSINGVPVARKRLTFSGALAQTDVPAVEVIKTGGNETAHESFKGSNVQHISVYEADGDRVGPIIDPAISGASYYGIDVYGANGDIYVADKANTKAYILDSTGTLKEEITGPQGENGCAAGPFGAMERPTVAVDQSNGNVLVSDIKTNGTVHEFNASGECQTTIERTPAFADANPSDIAVDDSGTANDGNAYITSGAGPGSSVFAYGPLVTLGATLSVDNEGSGEGTVSSTPAGIDCGSECEFEFEADQVVELEADAEAGSEFSGWTAVTGDPGTCTGTTSPCSITLDEDKQIEATFELIGSVPLTVIKGGYEQGGTVVSTPAGIDCGTSCDLETANFEDGSTVSLEASAAPGYVFAGWLGCKYSGPGECEVTVEGPDTQVFAVFVKDGVEGPEGPPGEDGEDGEQGLPGEDGEDGAPGVPGAPGPPGADGNDGLDGADGQDGSDGAAGANGLNGQDGAAGPQGSEGAPGAQGPRGKQGPPGKVTCKVVQKGKRVKVTCKVKANSKSKRAMKGKRLGWRLMHGGKAHAHGSTVSHNGHARVRLNTRKLDQGRYVLRVQGQRPTVIAVG
jgi:hypothetical protein